MSEKTRWTFASAGLAGVAILALVGCDVKAQPSFERPPASRFAVLRHPLFLAALGLLLLNDHVLKGARVLLPRTTPCCTRR